MSLMPRVHTLGIVVLASLLAGGAAVGCRTGDAREDGSTSSSEQALLGASPPARTILHHGNVFTAAPDHAWAEAIAIEGDHIVAVGSNASVLAYQRPGTKVIDLGGRTVIPGLNDAHVHVVVPEGQALNTLDFRPGPGPTLGEMEGLISSAAAAAPAGTWLLGFVGTNVFDDASADRFALDTVSPDHPVALFAWTGHGTWLNTAAMTALGIAEQEPDPFGGHYDRVAGSAVLTGKAHEYAEFGIRRRLLALLPDSHLVAQYQAFARDAVRFGFTSIQDMAVGLTRARSMAVLRAADLPIRVRSICFALSLGESCDVPRSHDDSDRPLLRAMGVKWVTDGTPVERNAFLGIPYADLPGWKGEFNFAAVPLHDMLEQARKGPAWREQRLFHSVGDGAIDDVLSAMEGTGGPGVWHDRRTRIEHGDLLFPSDFARAKRLGVVIVQNPTHLALAPVFAQRFTPAVFQEMEPLRSLLEQHIPLALGTDGIGSAFNPFLDLFLAMIHPTHPSEALTIEQAVTAYTRGSAYAEFEEDRKGTLSVGRLADLAVLSQDIFHIPPPAIIGTTSVLTIVNGNVVWDAGTLGSP
ncbi:MAG: Exoenzyme regulatory protein AepA precursor [Myxococcaceae bacterium]|nr:Exoenzyme regulatory protein AepA precursor [Myxococcaceae bacterium]